MPCNFCRKKKKSSRMMEREFNIECLDEHNRLRSLHGVEALRYSENLAKSAQAFAEKLALTDRLEHSNAEHYGETLVSRYCTRECNMTGKQAALVWYSEIENYDFHCENQLSCGNFSQVVWKSTKEAGFGIAKTQDGHRIYAVGHYSPPGNYTNEWVENVPPPLEGRIHLPTKEELGIGEEYDSPEMTKLQEEENINDAAEILREFMDSSSNSSEKSAQECCARSSVSDESQDRYKSISKDNMVDLETDSFVKVIDDVFGLDEEDGEKLEPIRLPKMQEKQLLWTRKQIGVAKDKKGSKVLFMKTTKRFFNYGPDDVIKDVIQFIDMKSKSDVQLDEKYTIKFTEPEQLTYEDLDKFQQEVYELHNLYRKHHNAKPLILDQELCNMAQEWAIKMRKEGKPFYPNAKFNDIPLGENVCFRNTYFDHLPANDLMSVWEKEAEDYDYSREDNDITLSGHFTQVIWKDTQLIGIGRARCTNINKTYVVIFYYPPGNVVGRYRENLEPRSRIK